MTRTWLVTTAVTVLALGRPANAKDASILVVRGADDERSVAADAVRRIAAELATLGYGVETIETERREGAALEDDVARNTHAQGALGAIALIPVRESAGVIALRSYDPSDGSWERRDLLLDERDAGAVLAIRAVELLRAHVVLRTLASPAPKRPPPPPEPEQRVAAAPPPPQIRWAVELAGGAHASPTGAAAVFAPWLRLGWHGRGWGGRITLVPDTTTMHVTAARSEADVRQRLASAALVYGVHAGSLDAYALAGAAVVRFEARGDATAPYRGVASTVTTGAAQFGVGATYWISRAVGTNLELGALFTGHDPVVRGLDADARRLGHVWLVATLGLVVAPERTP